MCVRMGKQQVSEAERTCASLLNELQCIWNEVGETEEGREKMLLELQRECVEVYRRKVDQADCSRASMHQKIVDIQSEIVALASILGERPPMLQLDKKGITLREHFAQLKSLLESMKQKKEERLKQLTETQIQIQRIQQEILSSMQAVDTTVLIEHDLTQRKLEELQLHLRALQKEKIDRLYKVMEHVNSIDNLCAVLGQDFLETIRKVHPSLDDSFGLQVKSISNETLDVLGSTIHSLKEEKKRRLQQIQDLGASLLELWNLMDTPVHEQHKFQHVTCNIAAVEQEVVAAGSLSFSIIQQAEAEVQRLEKLKASRVKELVSKKLSELDEICQKAHLVLETVTDPERALASMESGMVNPAELLASIEEQIGNVKEEAFSRKDILEKYGKWMAACFEESWLDEYNKDENRYNATRGAHLNLRRAEKARVAVTRIPVLLEVLMVKTKAWEDERGKPFLYDGVSLLSILDNYTALHAEKEEEKRRQRDQKRVQEQIVYEQERVLGSKPSPGGRTLRKKTVSAGRLKRNGMPCHKVTSGLQQQGAAGIYMSIGGVKTRSGGTPNANGKGIQNTKLTNRVLVQESDTSHTSGSAPTSINSIETPMIQSNGGSTEHTASSNYHWSFSSEKQVDILKNSPSLSMSMQNQTVNASLLTEEYSIINGQPAYPQQLDLQCQCLCWLEQLEQLADVSFEEKRLAFLWRGHADCK